MIERSVLDWVAIVSAPILFFVAFVFSVLNLINDLKAAWKLAS